MPHISADYNGLRIGTQEITRWGIRVLLVLLVFALGIALGEALHDNPKPGNTVTFERTLSIPSGPPGSTVIP